MRTIRVVFHLGLFVAASVLVLAAARIIWGGAPLGKTVAISYALFGLLHVATLGLLATRLPLGLKPGIGNWLYTAGFVHTLIALGTAIASTAALSRGTPLTLDALVPVLAPIGVAVLPHAVAVWVGHAFESTRVDALVTLEESLVKALTDGANSARGALTELYSQREDLLRNEVAALRRQIGLWDQAHKVLVDSLGSAQSAIEKSMSESQGQLEQLGRAAAGIAGKLQAPLERVGNASNQLADDVKGAAASAGLLREQLASAAKEASGLRPAIKETAEVVREIRDLHESIVELLSSELFKRR